jgi:biopolymer transport protein ExbD
VRFFLLAVLVVTTLLAGGCGDERDPIPVYNVEVLDQDGAYTIDDQRMDERQLEDELRRRAEASRRNVTHTSRAQVYITSRQGVDRTRVERLISFCVSLGYMQTSEGGR